MAPKLQIKRGLKKDLPTLASGEFGLCEDTGELFVGTQNGNLPVRSEAGAGDMLKSVYDTDNDGVVDRAESVPWAGVTGKPASMPANGGNADTLDGKHASEFASAAQGSKADSAIQTLQIGTVTGGNSAQATILTSGNTSTLNLTLPKGETGPQGPKGDTGARGATGATGPQGSTGARGATGATGPQGPQGPAGPMSTIATRAGNDIFQTGPSNYISVDGSKTTHIRGDGGVYINNGAGNGWSYVYASSFNSQSSRRYKEHIRALTEDDARQLLALEPVQFDYINHNNGTNRFGLIAEDAYAVQPQGVALKEIDGKQVPDAIDYSAYVPQLIKLCQLQQAQIDALAAENKQLTDALAALAARVTALEKGA